MATKVMVVNKPLKATIKWVNVWPNDITKNDGKGYGASLALKGIIDGVPDTTVYPKGFFNKNIDALVKAGVIDDGFYPHDPAEKYSIPVKDGEVTMELAQAEKERYPTFKISTAATHHAPLADNADEPYEVGYLPGDENYETPKPNGKPVVADALPTKIDHAHWSAFNEVMTKYVPVAVKAGAVVNVDVNALTFQLFEARRTGR